MWRNQMVYMSSQLSVNLQLSQNKKLRKVVLFKMFASGKYIFVCIYIHYCLQSSSEKKKETVKKSKIIAPCNGKHLEVIWLPITSLHLSLNQKSVSGP
jgi:hypothetical protein